VLISLVIIYRWVDIISEQVKKIVGHTAPPEYIEKVRFCALACGCLSARYCPRALVRSERSVYSGMVPSS
jgi:divalent metal cation (Fe/Co/Zn/Cd) transporter